MTHTEEAPGTCPQCGAAVGGTETECASCGWRLHRATTRNLNLGVIRRDIEIDGAVAFHEGEVVRIEAENPDEKQPEQKYLVTSAATGKQLRLSDADVFHGEDMPRAARAVVEAQLVNMRDSGILTPAEFEQARDALSRRLAEGNETSS